MRRYCLSAKRLQNDMVQIDGDIFHHIFDVCRQEVGSRFEILLNDNRAYLVEVISVEKRRAMARVVSHRDIAPLVRPHLKLALSIPRFPVFESVLEKCVELGVHSVHPFFSDYSYVRSGDKISENKWDRWQKIILSATQQSGRGQKMELMPVQSIEQILLNFKDLQTSVPTKQGLFAFEGRTTLGIKDYLLSLDAATKGLPLPEFWLFVGSEGGFSEAESVRFSESGLRPITLGSQILRVETACVTLVGILKYHFNLTA